jgi:hypothetical protein
MSYLTKLDQLKPTAPAYTLRSWILSWAMTRNIVIRYVSFVSLSSVCYFLFEFESCRRFQFSFTGFSLVYRFAFAQIFSRSEPISESNTSTELKSLKPIMS